MNQLWYGHKKARSEAGKGGTMLERLIEPTQ